MGVRKHIWRVSCGPGVFGNSLQSTASVDFIILIAKCENISKAHIYILHKHGGGQHAQESDPNHYPTTDGQSPTLARYLGTDVCTCGH